MGDIGIGTCIPLQSPCCLKKPMLIDSQDYKAIKATGGVGRDEFLKATRLHGYQGDRRGRQG